MPRDFIVGPARRIGVEACRSWPAKMMRREALAGENKVAGIVTASFMVPMGYGTETLRRARS